MKGIRAGLLACVVLSGCYNLKYYDSTVPGPGKTHEVWVDAFAAGLVTLGEMDLSDECPTGVYKMRSNHSFVDVLLTVVTLGIYTPVTVIYTCGSGPPPAP